MIPVIAIIGRPNVGKSTIFNRLIGEKKAIVSDIPGTTRDRLYELTNISNKKILLVDTGGILKPDKNDPIELSVQEQTKIGIEEANIIILVLDGKAGFFPEDRIIIRDLQKSKKDFLIVINKVDSPKIEEQVKMVFDKLGLEYIETSAIHNLGFYTLQKKLQNLIPKRQINEINKTNLSSNKEIAIALVGKPNVGKSSLINSLSGKNVSIVSEIPGTTRDTVDTKVTFKEEEIRIIDTAGLRRRTKLSSKLEYLSYIHSIKTIEKADICVIVVDALEPISHFEKTIFQLINDSNKGCIFVVNKWDLIDKEKSNTEDYVRFLRANLRFCPWIPIIFISAKLNKKTPKVLEKVLHVATERKKRIPTSALNQIVAESKTIHPPAALNSTKKHPRIYYLAQTGTKPPEFTLFVNDSKILHSSYLRFLEKRLRSIYGFEGTPLKFILKGKENYKTKVNKAD